MEENIMKVYMAMAIFSEKEYEMLHSVLDMREGSFNIDHWQYLYGFTNNKKLFKKFCRIHKKFDKKIIEMDEEEYGDFRKDHKSSEISIYSFVYGINYNSGEEEALKVKLPCTKNEYVYSVDYCSETYYADIAALAVIDPAIFKDEYKEVLQFIGYVDSYMDTYASDEAREEYLYNDGFYIAYGTNYPIYQARNKLIENRFNEVGFLITLFHDLLNIEELHTYIIERIDIND